MPFASANRQSTFLPSWDKAREFHRDVHKFFRMQAQHIFQICTLLFAFVLSWLPSSVFHHQQKSRIAPFSILFPEQKEKGPWNPVEGIDSWVHLAQQCSNNAKQKANQQMLLFGILQPLLVLKALLHCAISSNLSRNALRKVAWNCCREYNQVLLSREVSSATCFATFSVVAGCFTASDALRNMSRNGVETSCTKNCTM